MHFTKARQKAVAVALLMVLGGPAQAAAPLTVAVDWNNTLRISKTTPTLQVVVNPKLRGDSPVRRKAYAALKALGADYVRYVPWIPYPRLAVAELQPPAGGKTSWDFSLIDPMTTEFLDATAGHKPVLDFSTMPAWLFKIPAPVAYPDNPDEVTWKYTQGNELADPTAKAVGEYYGRVAGWYAKGGFTDEAGKFHKSGHHYEIPYWEVLNEPEFEHALTPEQYTRIYDEVVAAVHAVSPQTKFVGLSLARPYQGAQAFEYFLNPANHRPGTPVDMISYHFYALPAPEETPNEWQYSFFDQAESFLATVGFIESIRKRLSPETGTTINELGTILPADIMSVLAGTPDDDAKARARIPAQYWSLSGALYAYLYAELAKLGIDVVGESQLVGYPTQFPTVSMVDWTDGTPNARFRALKLIKDHLGPGDAILATSIVGAIPQWAAVSAQAFRSARGARQILLVNKRSWPAEVILPGEAAGGTVEAVGTGANQTSKLATANLTLAPFAVAVVTLP